MSETAPATDSSAPASRLGAELRTRRQSLGWDLPDLAASLRIRQPYLEAIEAGRMGELPGSTYAFGFVRAYASALGLPGEQVASRFRAESAEANVRPALSFPAPVPQRGVPAGALMLLGLVILAGAYGAWYYVSAHQSTPAETVPPIPDRLQPNTPDKPTPSPATLSPPTPSPQVASILPTASAPTQPAPVPHAPPASAAMVQPPTPAPTPAPASGPQAAPSRPPNAASRAATAAAPATANATPAVAAPGSGRMVVKATADAWVTVKQKAGPPLLNKLMHAGESWPVPDGQPGLTLTTGNAGGTEVDVDATPVVSLGASGAVRRDLPLDPDMLKSGHLPPSGRLRARPAPAAQPTQ